MSARCGVLAGLAGAVAALLVGAKPAAAAEPTVALVVQGADSETGDVELALAGVVAGWGLSQIDPATVRAAFGLAGVDPAAPLDDELLRKLRMATGADRIVAVVVRTTPEGTFLAVIAADASGVTRRLGESKPGALGVDAARLALRLPAPAAETAPRAVERSTRPMATPSRSPDEGVAPTHVEKRRIRALLVTSVICTLGGYAASIFLGLQAANPDHDISDGPEVPGRIRIGAIPLVGAFILIPAFLALPDEEDRVVGSVFSSGAGVAQLAGVGFFVLWFVTKRNEVVPGIALGPDSDAPRLSLLPMPLGTRGAGAILSIRGW